MRIPPGGPSTVNGILCQLLWTLLTAVRFKIIESDADPDRLSATRATLIVEPKDGGDLQHVSAKGRRIQQVKMRSGRGSWSLVEVIDSVLPDLYKAVDLTRSADHYEFITNGHRGD